jgi:hypothetical protein
MKRLVAMNQKQKEAIIVRLFDGNSDATIRNYERKAAREILAIVEKSFPNGLKFASQLLEWDDATLVAGVDAETLEQLRKFSPPIT